MEGPAVHAGHRHRQVGPEGHGEGRLTSRLIILSAAAALLGGCGSSSDGSNGAARRATSVSVGAVRSDRDAEVALGNAFRRQLRTLSVMTGAAGETGDIGQPVPTGYVDRAACRAGDRSGWACNVRWTDIDGTRHSTGYRVAARASCTLATATPSLGDVIDVTAGGPAVNPLSELELGGSEC